VTVIYPIWVGRQVGIASVVVEIRLVIPPEALSGLARAIADALPLERQSEPQWLAGAAAAADYLGWPVQRVYKHLHALPHTKHGARLMFERDKLDEYLRAL
jgi:hypothetical protein